MARETVVSPGVYPPVGPYSQAVKVGPLLFVSGLLPLEPTGTRVKGGATKEAERVLENLKGVLEAAGAKLEHVVRTTVYLVDLDDFKYVNQVYERYFPAAPPARTTVQVSKLPRDVRLEIDAIAVVA